MSIKMISKWNMYFSSGTLPTAEQEYRQRLGAFLLDSDAKKLDCGQGVWAISGILYEKNTADGDDDAIKASEILTSPVLYISRQADDADILIVHTVAGYQYCIRAYDYSTQMTFLKEFCTRSTPVNSTSQKS